MTDARSRHIAAARKQRLLREALVDIQAFVPGTATEESTMQATRDNGEVKHYRVIGIGIPAAILVSIAAGLMSINAPAPVSTASARLVTAATHAVPDASTVLDARAAVEPLPPTF